MIDAIAIATIAVVLTYFAVLAALTALAPPYIGPKVKPTNTMQQRALDRYGFLLEELEEQFFERLRLMRRMPFLSRTWRELWHMLRVSAARLREVKGEEDG